MPTYEYRCRDCGEDHEVIQGFHDDALTVCPSCRGDLRRRFSAVGIAFKGSGFYKNDSRSSTPSSSDSTSTAGSSDDGSSPSSDTSSGSTSDDKKTGDKKTADKKAGHKSKAATSA